MRIKRLELLGFKSFMTKTVINFDAGLTGIVGPNGCGKSNIVDALLWVMGEQSPKHLRGGMMEDVIFNGSDKYKPSSISEVSVTLENDGVFPASYLDFSEITITRRLYRDGESEYLINKIQVRLKDVKEIFMDSGARTYAVIEQGEIERIILAKPDDRRAIIEEAAGITRYRVRKEESNRKLGTTQQNLLRLNDIISELEKQLSQLERQAKKAKVYRSIRDDLKSSELKLGAYDYSKLNTRITSLREELTAHEEEKERIESDLSRQELDLESEKAKKLGIEEKLSNFQNRTIELNTAIHKAKAQLEVIEAEKANLLNSNGIRSDETESLKIRIQKGEDELGSISGEFVSHIEIVKAANEDVERVETELNKKTSEFETLSVELENKKSTLLEHMQKQLTAKNNISNFKERLESNLIKVERYERDKIKYEEELISTRENLSLLEGNFKDNQRKREELDNELMSLQNKGEELKGRASTKEREREEAVLRLNSVNSRLEVLFELSKKLEGVSSGVCHIVNSGRWENNIRGLLADVIETAPEFEKAVGAAVGSSLEAIVIDTPYSTLEIIGSLKDEKKGQASFLPMNLRHGRKTHSDHIFNENVSKTTYLLDHIKYDEKYSELIKSIFANVYLVDDLNTALDLWNRAMTSDFILVTPDGDIVDGTGVVRGGSAALEGGGLLERKREIKELGEEKESLAASLSVLENECSTIKSETEDTHALIDGLKVDISKVAVELATLSKELDLVREDLKRQEQRFSELNFDLDQIRFENTHLEREIEAADAIFHDSGEAKVRLEAELKEGKTNLDLTHSNLELIRKKVTELKVHASTVSERFRSVEERRTFLKEALEGDKSRLENLYSEESRSQTRERELLDEFERIKKQSHLDMEALDTLGREINEVKCCYSESVEAVSTFEKVIKERRLSLNNQVDDVHSINVTLAELSVNTGVLKQRFLDRYEVDLTIVYSDYTFDDFNEEEIKQEVEGLNKKLTDLGEVNLLATQEFDNLGERHSFLTGQRDDLIKSMEDLKRAIKKIDDTSIARFKNTFELVNEKFQRFFPILFGGGTARLVMTDPNDLLGTGIDVFAQLPGKKTQNINLFSGGEKALTAISLVFSVFAIKPSPFCILDEVDAPLDDANIARFNEAVKALMDKSQFVIITHNKKTMEMLDVLYGVTMEEPGISRMVSVRMGEFERDKDFVPSYSYKEEEAFWQ